MVNFDIQLKYAIFLLEFTMNLFIFAANYNFRIWIRKLYKPKE